MKKFDHFLITRINVDWNISRPRSLQERTSPKFLDYRLEILEKSSLIAIKRQQSKNFKWIIMLDAATPSEYVDQIKHCQAGVQIIPLLITSKETCLSELKQTLSEHLSDQTTHLITTNLDSDDVISKDFISNIQAHFHGQEFEFLNYAFGYLYIINQKQLYLREWLTAPCHTLIEKRENFQTVSSYRHSQIPTEKVRQIFTSPKWLMTVHEMNVRTKFDVAAAWQPLNRMRDDFIVGFDVPQKDGIATVKELLSQVKSTLFSTKHWDTPKVKTRKTINILFPAFIRTMRKIQYRQL